MSRVARFVVGIVALGLIVIALANPIGRLHAWLASMVGARAVMTYGLCNGPCRVAQEILADRYGIRAIPVAGCSVLGPEVWYSDGYNAVARAAIIRQHGRDVFQEAHDEAMRRYKESRPFQVSHGG